MQGQYVGLAGILHVAPPVVAVILFVQSRMRESGADGFHHVDLLTSAET
jgi:hypothetical protein